MGIKKMKLSKLPFNHIGEIVEPKNLIGVRQIHDGLEKIT